MSLSENEQAVSISLLQNELPAGIEVLEFIAEGGFAVVYKAQMKLMDRLVAVKVIKGESSDLLTEQFERIQREAKLLARLSHENIVRVYQAGLTAGGSPFFVFEYLDGKTLQEYLDCHKTLSHAEILEIFPQILDALQFAHEHGLVHRDIKPSNIMLQRQPDSSQFSVKLLDFGIAREYAPPAGSELITMTEGLSGSPLYMSPEQCRGERLGPTADLYSLACVLYQCVYGEPPFSGESAYAIMYKHLNESPAAIQSKNQQDRKLGELLKSALAKDRQSRPQSAEEFKTRLLLLSRQKPDLSDRWKYVVAATLCLSVFILATGFLVSRKTTVSNSALKGKTVKQKDRGVLASSPEYRLTDLFLKRNHLNTQALVDDAIAELEQILQSTKNRTELRFAALYLQSTLAPQEKRKKILEEALELCRTPDGKEYFEAAHCYYLLAELAGASKRYEQEQVYLEKAQHLKDLSESTTPPANLALAQNIEREINAGFESYLLRSLGMNAIHRKDYKAALPFFEALRRITSGADPAQSADARLCEATVWVKLNDLKKANEIVDELYSEVRAQVQGDPPRDARQAMAFADIAKWQYTQHQLAACRKTLEQALSIVKRNMPQENLRAVHEFRIKQMEQNLAELKATQTIREWDTQPSSFTYKRGRS